MSELNELAAALVAFQGSAPTIPKVRTAMITPKSGKSYSYRYADLSDIWDAIREPLKTSGLAVTQSLVGGSSGFIGIRTTLWHTSGQSLSDVVEFPISHQSRDGVVYRTAQEMGSQITYFKRYALSAVLGLSTDEDDDGAAASRRVEGVYSVRGARQEPARTEIDDALDELDDACAALGLHTGEVASKFYVLHDKPARQTDAKTVRAFIESLHDKHGQQATEVTS